MSSSVVALEIVPLQRIMVCLQVCFVIQELDLVLQSSKRTLPDFFKDLAVALVLGKVLPILVAAVIEARSRADFLKARWVDHTSLVTWNLRTSYSSLESYQPTRRKVHLAAYLYVPTCSAGSYTHTQLLSLGSCSVCMSAILFLEVQSSICLTAKACSHAFLARPDHTHSCVCSACCQVSGEAQRCIFILLYDLKRVRLCAGGYRRGTCRHSGSAL